MASYLYGLVPAGAPAPAVAGLQGQDVTVWALGDEVALLRSDLDDDTIQPRRAHLTAHDHVLASAMEASPVLPLRFGLVTDLDAERVRAGLDVEAALDRMHALRGKVEVQVLWTLHEDAALPRVAVTRPEVRDGSLPAVDRGRLVAETLTALACDDLGHVVARLGDVVVDRGSIESRGTGDARVALLVAARDLVDVVATCDGLAHDLDAMGRLRTVAGLPPYTFADLDVTVAGA